MPQPPFHSAIEELLYEIYLKIEGMSSVDVQGAIDALKGNVPAEGDTLEKLYNLISARQRAEIVPDIPARDDLNWGTAERSFVVHVVNAYKDFPLAGQGDATVETPNTYAAYIWDGSQFFKMYEKEGIDVDFRKRKIVTQSITGSVIVDLTAADMFLFTITGNISSFNFSNEVQGKDYLFLFTKETTEKSFVWTPGKYRFPFGNPPALTNPTQNGTSPARSVDIITALCSVPGRLDLVVTPNLIEN